MIMFVNLHRRVAEGKKQLRDQTVSRVHQLLVKLDLYFYTMGTHFGKPLISRGNFACSRTVGYWPDLKVFKRVI